MKTSLFVLLGIIGIILFLIGSKKDIFIIKLLGIILVLMFIVTLFLILIPMFF